MSKKSSSYGASQIQALEGLEAVRKRPGMYIGSTSARGLHHLVWEIVDNAVDEHLAGFCNEIDVIINKDDSITVKDNGRGIPIENHPKFDKPTVEVVLTVLHAGGKFGGGGYKVSGGLHGVGSSVVNALSTYMSAEVINDGKIHKIEFERGATITPLYISGEVEDKEETGTIVTFKPDAEIFKETTTYNFDTIFTRMRESAFLNPGLLIRLTDKREVDPETNDYLQQAFLYHQGLLDYVQFLNQSKKVLHDDVFYVSEMHEGVQVDVAMQYTDSYGKDGIFSYVNNVKTSEGGTHEDGFKRALTTCMKEYIQLHSKIKGDELPSGEDMRIGLTAIVSVKVTEPQFEGQTKGKLGNSEVRPAVEAVVQKFLSKFLAERPEQSNVIIQKIVDSFEERMAARKARMDRREKTQKESNGNLDMPSKLADCSSKVLADKELFLVEGDSAGGTAKLARNKVTQAILPLRGKVINTEKAKMEKINANEEIKMIYTVIGTDIDEYFDYDKLRYDKIVIMTDADVDGSHIRILLLTFFYRYMRPLVERGHIYIANPPLYALKGARDKILMYCWNEKELEEGRKKHPNAKTTRYKGLGEMSNKQLEETTMDPSVRTLDRVTVEDAAEAEELFHRLMGDESHLRKEYIEKNGHKADFDI